MDSADVLEYLKSQFSGKLVLYVDDLAKILGKSDKAVANLIARNALPFRIKMVGGLRCVDIFQVAQWLSSNAEISTQVSQQSVVAKPTKQVKPGRSKKTVVTTPFDDKNDDQVGISLMASKILQMRHDYAAPMARFVTSLRDPDELLFMHELQEVLFYCADPVETSFAATVRKLAPKGFKHLGGVSTRYFASEVLATEYLLRKLSHSRNAESNKHVLHFVLSRSSETLFHAVVAGRNWAVVSNSMRLELPGL